MMKNASQVLRMFLWLTFLTGIVYPFLITGIAQLTMKHNADGRFIDFQGRKAGALLIAQKFEDAKFFWPRPSAINYDPLRSGGSNLGPTSEKLRQLVKERQNAILQTQQGDPAAIPSDLLYASGSGLDPHISPAAALFQVERIVKARGWNEEGKQKLLDLIQKLTTFKGLGFLGKSHVNVLELNLALEDLSTSANSEK